MMSPEEKMIYETFGGRDTKMCIRDRAVRQKERLRAMKEKKELEIGHAQQADSMEEEVPEDAQGMNMTM